MLYTQARFANRQSKSRAFIAADVHYDLGNDLFAGTFDSRLTGSCGYWAEADELDASQAVSYTHLTLPTNREV